MTKRSAHVFLSLDGNLRRLIRKDEPIKILEYCDCTDASNYRAIYVVDYFNNQRADIWVHSKCMRPSEAKWLAGWRYCHQCGQSFSAPLSAETCCPDCPRTAYSDHPCLIDPGLPYIGWDRIRDLGLKTV